MSVSQLVFVDESGASTQMTRRYGRSPIGQRLNCPVPHGHYQTTTMIAAVGLKGPRAPWLFGGAMDGPLFLGWVKQGLVPCLQPDDVVIMDNLATHKVAGVREAIEALGAKLEYLPPYSPDFNPIESMWSKVKQTLKRKEPRNARQLLKAAKTAFAAVSSPLKNSKNGLNRMDVKASDRHGTWATQGEASRSVYSHHPTGPGPGASLLQQTQRSAGQCRL